jgi:uncharacterized protein
MLSQGWIFEAELKMHRGIATFTLDTGRCPPWLFQRMVKLGREMTRVLVAEFGPDEFVRRIADPYDQTIAALSEAVRHSHMAPTDKDGALKRLTEAQNP